MTDPGRRRKPPTIHDVAREAGVSRGTVSRVLNGGHYVSPTAREAVNAAIGRTGYVVNRHARSLATGRSDSIAFLLTEPQDLFFEDPNFNVLLRGCTAGAGRARPPAAADDRRRPTDERRRITRYITAGHVDGVLLVSSHSAATRSRPNCARRACRWSPAASRSGIGSKVSYVAADDRDGAREMVRHLLAPGRRRDRHGHRPAGHPRRCGPAGRLPRRADRGGRCRTTTRLVVTGDYSRASGEAAMPRCWPGPRTWTRCSSRPT